MFTFLSDYAGFLVPFIGLSKDKHDKAFINLSVHMIRSFYACVHLSHFARALVKQFSVRQFVPNLRLLRVPW